MKINKIIGYTIISLYILVLPVALINASTVLDPDMVQLMEMQMESTAYTGGSFEDTSMMEIISIVIKGFLSLLGIVFLVLMLYGGLTWMTAQGDESKIEKAKSTIQTAVIGLIIVVSAYSITYTIFNLI